MVAVSGEELTPQIDFSGGQINLSARRREDLPAVKAGGRTVLNWRTNNTGQLEYRPGRRALFMSGSARTEYIRVSTGEEFMLAFPDGGIAIYNLAGLPVASNYSSAYKWSASAGVNLVSWAQAQDSIYVAYPASRPQVIKWDRGSRTWGFSAFAFDSSGNTIKQPYYRLSAPGASIAYSAVSGSVTLTCDEDYFTSGMIGTTLSIVGQQVTITAVASGLSATATPSYRLPDMIAIQVQDTTPFQVGQIVESTTQNIKIEVGYVDTAGKWVHGILLSNIVFTATQYTNSDTLVSPVGSSKFGSSAPVAGNTNLPTVQWQEEFMSDRMGWPASVGFDRGRVIFCDFPQAQNAALWSAISAPNTYWVDSVAAATQPDAGSAANAAILELVNGTPRVRYIVGWQQGQFAFTDRGAFFIPISNSSPLKPGSVEFDQISNDGVGNIRPVPIQDAIVFMNAGLQRVSAVRATGSYTRPFIVEDVSDPHTDLFVSPRQIVVASGDGSHPERYVYVLNSDGRVILGKFSADRSFIGWQPWASTCPVEWVTAAGPSIYYTSGYAGLHIVELEDDGLFLDCAIPINSPPAGLAATPGKGPLWFMAGATIALMDGNADLGDHVVDANGFVTPIYSEDLSSPTLVGGLFAQALFQPIVRTAGTQHVDRTKRINISRAIANVEEATDFTIGSKAFPAQRFGDDGAGQPALMDGSFRVRILGRSFDPTVDFVKHRPGPIRLCEFSMKVSN